MLNTARWAVFGLLAASVLALTFAVGYVIAPGDDNGGDEPADSANGNGASTQGEFDFETLNQIMQQLKKEYVDPGRIDEETLYQAAINGMLNTLSDSGTFYVDPVTVRTSTGPSGSFEGIGATVSTNEAGEIVIVSPIENTPAERVGIRAGDVLLEVDGESTNGWTQEIAVLRIRGPKGTTVNIKVRHSDGTEESFEIERDEIEVRSVTTQPPGGVLRDAAGNEITDVGYIGIREFSQPTRQQFREAVDEVLAEGAKSLIIDVRNNPGGLLTTTVEIADEFLNDGIVLIERERDGNEQTFSARRGGVATEFPIVILQNQFSASGAEVLAAALHDNGRATIVGETSFGKGTVNRSFDLDDSGQLYVSIAKWLTPDGVQIDGVGVRPDITVTLSDEDIDLRRDVQLFKAIDVLRGTNFTPPSALTPVPTPTAEATQQPGG
jgi:carboxyl-terminal processing protease